MDDEQVSSTGKRAPVFNRNSINANPTHMQTTLTTAQAIAATIRFNNLNIKK